MMRFWNGITAPVSRVKRAGYDRLLQTIRRGARPADKTNIGLVLSEGAPRRFFILLFL